jgi:quercetin dioxygenase-like cupin family protein
MPILASNRKTVRHLDSRSMAIGDRSRHGAAATTAMTHIAIAEALEGKVADWMEKVADEQYQV